MDVQLSTAEADNLIERLRLSNVETDMGELRDDGDDSQQRDGSGGSQRSYCDNKSQKKMNLQQTFKKVFSTVTAGPGGPKMTRKERNELLKSVTVGPLPQRFLVKFIGSKPCEGLWGSKHTRTPVDLMVKELREMDKRDDLPLINVKISQEGFKVSLHPNSKSTKEVPDLGLVPLQFISYAVQDARYSKVFAFVVVREMSSRKRMTECHAYLCDSIVSCRKMALTVANAFQLLQESVKDQPHKFQVDLKSVVDDNTEI